jgi:hypothetical protein
MLIRVVSRETEPHLISLAVTLAPLLAVANSGSFHLRYQSGVVIIEQSSFHGVNLSAVDAAVLAAPAHTSVLAAKAWIDTLDPALDAILVALVKLLNTERAQHGRPALTRAAFLQLAKDEL